MSVYPKGPTETFWRIFALWNRTGDFTHNLTNANCFEDEVQRSSDVCWFWVDFGLGSDSPICGRFMLKKKVKPGTEKDFCLRLSCQKNVHKIHKAGELGLQSVPLVQKTLRRMKTHCL